MMKLLMSKERRKRHSSTSSDDQDESSLSASAKYERMMGYGRFQKFQVWVYSPLMFFIGGMCSFQLTFVVTRKPSRCALPQQIEDKYMTCFAPSRYATY